MCVLELYNVNFIILALDNQSLLMIFQYHDDIEIHNC